MDTMNKAMKDNEEFEYLRSWVSALRDRLIDPRQGGKSPELNEDGSKWRYSFMPKGVMYMEVDQMQLLLRYFNLPALEPVPYGGSCTKCVHGQNVSSATGMWPVIADCEGCISPSHPYFLPSYDTKVFNDIKTTDVFRIPNGGTIPIYVERLQKGIEEGDWEYYEAQNFVWRVSDKLRICRMEHLGLLHVPGNSRYEHRR